MTGLENPAKCGQGVAEMAGKKAGASFRMPANPTVKLPKEMFADLWWVARVEKRGPGDILKEMCGVALAARRKRVEAKVAQLVKLDEREDQIVSEEALPAE